MQTRIYTSAVGIRNVLQQGNREWTEERLGNDVAGKRLAGLGIIDGDLGPGGINEIAEITALHGLGWNGSEGVLRLILPEPVGADMEKGAVLAVV